MQRDRWVMGASPLATLLLTPALEETKSALLPFGQVAAGDGVGGSTGLLLALAAAAVGLLGGAILVVSRVRSSSEPANAARRTAGGHAAGGRDDGERTGADAGSTDLQRQFEDRIGEATLERLEPIAPDAVSRARELATMDGTETSQRERVERIDQVERELRRGVRDALSTGRLELTVESPYGEPYEIVNLPSRFREVVFPLSGDGIHVDDVDARLRELLEEERPAREIATAAATVDEHRAELETYVRRREERFETLRAEIETNLEGVAELTGRLEGPLGERLAEFVLEGRHAAVDGVVDIERRIADATRSLHRCSFEDATRELLETRALSDELLVTVDFLGGVVGTIDHGGGSVDLPDVVSVALVSDLVPVLERQYGVSVDIDDDRLSIETSESDGSAAAEPSYAMRDGPSSVGDARGNPESGVRASATVPQSRDHDAITPDSVSDEILFTFRELEGVSERGNDRLQFQTDRLPESVGRPEVLEELATFCARQTDVVDSVDLHDGAPPGFFELQFTDRTNARSGARTLRERFADRYGG